MDLNFHLLTQMQIKKLQDICLSVLPFKRKDFSFVSVRENANVIIEGRDSQGNYPIFDRKVDDKVTLIRDAIKREKERRLSEAERRGRPHDEEFEDWPGSNETWERRHEELRNIELEDNIEHWPEDLDNDVEGDYDTETYDRLIDKYSSILLNLPQIDGQLGIENYAIATNTDLQIMALDLFRLKSEQKHAAVVSNASGVTTLGTHFRYADANRKNDIFLFIDNIANEARYTTWPDGMPCTTDDLLEITFIHELFHAYYAFYSKHDFIFLRHFHEIEEAMAEMGTIWYCSSYDGGRLFDLARKVVMEKWNGGNPSLACYGFGAHLYDYLSPREEFIEHYQLVQRLFRYGNPDVTQFCQDLTNKNILNCCNTMSNLVRRLVQIKRSSTQHFYFRNDTTGENNSLVEMVLNHIAQSGGRAPRRIWLTSKNQYQDVFKDERMIIRQEQKYFDNERQISPYPGTTCSIWRQWQSRLDGNTITFIDAYNQGLISDRISII